MLCSTYICIGIGSAKVNRAGLWLGRAQPLPRKKAFLYRPRWRKTFYRLKKSFQNSKTHTCCIFSALDRTVHKHLFKVFNMADHHNMHLVPADPDYALETKLLNTLNAYVDAIIINLIFLNIKTRTGYPKVRVVRQLLVSYLANIVMNGCLLHGFICLHNIFILKTASVLTAAAGVVFNNLSEQIERIGARFSERRYSGLQQGGPYSFIIIISR